MATIAFAIGCYYMLDRLPVDREEFFGYAVTSLLLVVGLAVAAFVLVAAIKLAGRLFGANGSGRSDSE